MNEPIPEGVRMTGEWIVPAPPERVWELVSQTDRLNVALGSSPVRYQDSPDPRGGIARTGAYSHKGSSLTWDETPYEWIAGKQMSVFRAYHKSPLASFYLKVRLDPAREGTRLTSVVVMTPRTPVFKPIIYLVCKAFQQDLNRVYGHFRAYFEGRSDTPYVAPIPSPSDLQLQRCLAIGKQLEDLGFAPDLVDRLVQHVLTAQELDLQHMRPFAIATAWSQERRELLRLFLHATRAGLLELTWSLLCPGCRGTTERTTSLSKLSGNVHCLSCNISLEADFGQLVELSFRPNRAIRAIEQTEYCIGGPYRTAHVVMQALLDPRRPLDLELTLPPGTYRLRSPQVANHLTVSVHDDGPDAGAIHQIKVSAEGFGPVSLDLASTTLRLRLQADAPFQVMLEHTGWADDVVTGAYVSTLHEFRTLFSHEVLAADLELGITRIAIMFTDLKSSTAMYEQLGDATAFRLVQTHFRILEEAIARNHGAIVKTVGDAVMATFYDAADCVRAAFEIQTSIQHHNAQHPDQPAEIVVKLGAHIGPCIAVTLNEHLDYFGTTVNVAARIQNEAMGGDVVLSQAMLADPGVGQLLATLPVTGQSVSEASLKGLANTFELTRLVPDVRGLEMGLLRAATGRLS